MKNLLVLLLAFVAVRATAQETTNISRILLWQYNLNQTVTPMYCVLGTAISTSDRVTAANSTTVTAVSGAPFTNVSVGDMLHIVDSNGADHRRAVTVRNSSTSIVISGAAVTITSGKIQSDSKKVSCGTSAAFGAFDVTGFNYFAVQVDIGQQVNTGGLQFHLQCRGSADAQWVQQYPALTLPTMTLSYTPAITGTGRFYLATSDKYAQCRVGQFIATADDGDDLTTNAEQVSFTLIGRQ